ncbi:MAG: terminase small subunit [Pseudomonas sp.]|nr:terminase small subunit [Pseudomonas sp.]
MKRGITQKQRAYCLAFMETGNSSEAYRRSYDTSGMTTASVNRCAKDVYDNVNVSAMIEQLRKKAMKRNEITVDTLLDELEEARKAALDADTAQSSAAVSATMGKARLLGLDKKIVDHMSSDGSLMPTKIVLMAGKEE